MKSHCTPSMLKSKLIKLIFFESKEVRLLYIGATGFWSHTSSAIFETVLCLLCLYYAYYACTMPPMPVRLLCLLCLYYAYHACIMPTILVLCLLFLYYAYYACTMPTMPVLCSTMPIYNQPHVTYNIIF